MIRWVEPDGSSREPTRGELAEELERRQGFGTCPRCGSQRSLRRDGTIRLHRDPLGLDRRCGGSMKPPLEL